MQPEQNYVITSKIFISNFRINLFLSKQHVAIQ